MVIGTWHIAARSFVKAAKTIARYALMLGIALAEHDAAQLTAVLLRLAECLSRCQVDRRNKAPAAFQLLEVHDPDPPTLNTPQTQLPSTNIALT